MFHQIGGSNSPVILRAERLAKEKQQLYLWLLCGYALVGYFILFSFPLIVVASVYFLVHQIPAAGMLQDWVWVGLCASLTLLFSYLFFRVIKLRFSQVPGLMVSRDKVPDLFKLISEVVAHYRRPVIANVVITDKFEIRMEGIPRTGLPISFANTLVIGLPMLQTISPEEFRCELSRCIGTHSSLKPRMTLFIYKARVYWRQLNEILMKKKGASHFLLRWLFGYYAQLLYAFSAPAIRQEEIHADSFSLDYMNDHQVLDTLKSESISRTFLELHYWPSVRSMIIKNSKADIRPFSKLEKVLRSISSQESRKKWLQFAYDAEHQYGDPVPLFRERMESIGHIKIRSIPEFGVSAAEKYLGKNKYKIITIIDKFWYSATFLQWKSEYREQKRDLEEIQKLSRKSRQHILWPGEIWRYATIAKKLNGSSRYESMRKLVIRNFRTMMPEFILNRFRPAAGASDLFN